MNERRLALALAAVLICPSPSFAQSPTAADDAIESRLTAETTPVMASRVTLWAPADALPQEEARAFAAELDKAVPAIERLTGASFDAAHYGGSKIHVFVSGRVTVSHVYGGYSHAQYKRPNLYLNPRRVAGRSAPYLHELTHIILWDFGSHSLREGFASYVEAKLAQDGIGYNSGVFGPLDRAAVDKASAAAMRTPTGRALLQWIGKSGMTDPAITSADNAESRETFYLLTRSFVQHLLDTVEMKSFVELYRAKDTEANYRALTGRTLEEWRTSWQRSLEDAR